MLTSIYGVFLNAEGMVLLVKDAHSQVWGFPGGGVEAGETHDEVVRREFLEETGMSIVGEVVYITDQDDASKQRRFYKIAQVSGVLRKGGNGSDILLAAYFDTTKLPFGAMAPGVERIIESIE